MKILNRYILLECLGFIALTLAVFTGILFTVQLLRFSDLIINRGVEISQIATVFIAIIPTFLELALPLSALLGTMLAFGRFSGDSEIVVLRASGISIFQLLRPVLILASLLGALGVLVSTELKPWGYKTLAQSLFNIARSRTTSGLEAGVFNKLGDLTIYSEKIDYDSGEIEKVVVDDRRTENGRKIIFATRGEIASDENSQSIEILLKNGVIHEQQEGRYTLTRFEQNLVKVRAEELYGDKATQRNQPPRALYLNELKAEILRVQDLIQQPERPLDIQASDAHLFGSDLHKRLRRLDFELASRFSLPVASIILALIGVPLGIQPPRTQRTWGTTIAFILGLVTFAVYYGSLSIGLTAVEGGSISPYAACWIPNVICGALALILFYLVASERISSVAQLAEPVIRGYKAIRSGMSRR